MSRRCGLAKRWPLACTNPAFIHTQVTERIFSMTFLTELARTATRFRAIPLVALATIFGACNATDQLSNTSGIADTPADVPAATAEPTDASLSASFRGGIPIGYYAMPTTLFGGDYNGAHRNIWPGGLVRELSAIRARGGKVVLMFAGNERHYKSGGRFSLTKWKERVNRFRGINFTQFIKDGTIIAHYLIDEPNDAHNWGSPISGATLEEMARYSKQLWPGMPTVVRAESSYLAKFSTRYSALDAAWAQYVTRKGTPTDFIRRNVSDAQRKGLALVTGLNVSAGVNGHAMSGAQIKAFGSALLASSYPCAFISWQYRSGYASASSVKDAMRYLSSKARNRPTKSCRS
jgi:hypothetical protein